MKASFKRKMDMKFWNELNAHCNQEEREFFGSATDMREWMQDALGYIKDAGDKDLILRYERITKDKA